MRSVVCGSSYLALPVLISPSGAHPGSAGLPPPAAALSFSEDLELTPSHPVYHPETPGLLGPVLQGVGGWWAPRSAVTLGGALLKVVFPEHSVYCETKIGATAAAQGHCGMNFKQGFSLETPTLWLKGGTVR